MNLKFWIRLLCYFFKNSCTVLKPIIQYGTPNSPPLKLHLFRLLETQNWISIKPFYLKIEIQYWQFTSILKWNFNIDKIGLILSVQYWSSSSILRWTVNIEFQFWGKMSILKFNFEVLKACQNESLSLTLKLCQMGLGIMQNKQRKWKT